MDRKPPFFSNLAPADWLLAALFTIIVAYLVQSFFPPYGWLIGTAGDLAKFVAAHLEQGAVGIDRAAGHECGGRGVPQFLQLRPVTRPHARRPQARHPHRVGA